MKEYDRIADLIRYIEAHQEEQPGLSELARHAGLSESRIHRLFSAWAGITPKDFLQCVTLVRARELLKAGNSVLDTALASGLSGPGRLHDLCLHLDAATPGNIKAGGDGWVVSVGIAASPFGDCLIAESPRGICHLSFRPETAWSELQADWPNARLERNDDRAAQTAALVFRQGGEFSSASADPGRSEPERILKLFVRGSAFQVRVWRALLSIPEGMLTSYGHLAAYIGNPRASRAVGSAVGRNPISFLIPCHRVIRESGAIGGYGGGLIRKRAMLAWEQGGSPDS